MEIIPTLINGAVVLDVHSVCTSNTNTCRACPEQAVGIHNWLLSTGVKYVIVDFQDEKDVCKSILIELLQLRKRLNIPFIFVGLMDRPRETLVSHAYTGYPFFSAPEEAALHLRQMHSDLYEQVHHEKVVFDQAIPCSRSRHLRNSELGMARDDDDGDDYDDNDSLEESQ